MVEVHDVAPLAGEPVDGVLVERRALPLIGDLAGLVQGRGEGSDLDCPKDDANDKPLAGPGATAWALAYTLRGQQTMRGSAHIRIGRIVSGGQTGADRAALDWAIEGGVEHGGWCPRGRRAEDGVIPPRYGLEETPSERYEERTEWNVRDSDGTVILTLSEALAGGSLATAKFARTLGKPWLHLSRRVDGARSAEALRRFVADHAIRVLNVAGPRASGEPGIAAFVRETLDAALGTR